MSTDRKVQKDTDNRKRSQQKSHWLREGRTTIISHKERPGYGKLISQTAVIKSYCHSTLLRGGLSIVFLEFYLPSCLCCHVLWALKDVLRLTAGKTQSATFEPAQVKKNPTKYKSSDLQSDCNSKRSIKPDTSGQMWSVEWSSFFTVVSKIAIWEKEREKERGPSSTLTAW